jgi:hypothetical protein
MWLFKLRHKILDVIEPDTYIHDLGFQIVEVWLDPNPEDLLDTNAFPRVVAAKP